MPQELTIDADILWEFHQSMDTALQMITQEMADKNLETGVINAKIKIRMALKVTEDGQIIRNLKFEPDVKTKCGTDNRFDMGKTPFVIMDVDAHGRTVIAENQISMDELLAKQEKGA